MHQIEIILPDLTESINWAVTSSNGVMAGNSLALVISQYLLDGNFDLALSILQEPNSAALSTAMKHPR